MKASQVDSPEQWGVLKVGCVNTGSFNPEENKVLPDSLQPIPGLAISRNDLLISRANTRELVGRAAVAEVDYPRLMLCDKLYRRGAVQEPEKAYLREIIKRVNDLFEGELTEQDKLVYVNNVIKGKLLESETLKQQAASNTKEQFAASPDLAQELMHAIMGALDAHTTMSTQALNSPVVRAGLKDVLLNHAQLYESLRGEGAGGAYGTIPVRLARCGARPTQDQAFSLSGRMRQAP